MKKGLSALLFSVLLLTAVSNLPADDEKQQEKIHHEIVVTATRLETPLSEVASATTVVKVESLTPVSLSQAQNLLARVPGLFFFKPVWPAELVQSLSGSQFRTHVIYAGRLRAE